ncbi:16S rRNA (adenine(1518)-N(6)/adenine(1519)-N(6))-dimethyltransferase RsmA [Spiroplasma endosymbiont of Anurida maritima]|uniref:16S rRNA (adenine(1518)-N(6)/adenine(1519)-N(6))- dimethyltransferase RsmA n=1 Tax=Spiroplasma endosymbiont of Anurida maritima TaxID=2967972 RepID=UPI0036D259BA
MKFKAKKKFGQNFLIDNNIINKIIEATTNNGVDNIIEVGPGLGALTKYLLDKNLYAYEIDTEAYDYLLKNFPEKSKNILNKDFLEVDIVDDTHKFFGNEPFNVVSNVPYYITSPIIFKFLESDLKNLKTMTFMVQKEVGDRIIAKPNNKQYGNLSVICQFFCDIEKVTNVSRNCFRPAPDVDSIVIKMTMNKKFDVKDVKNLQKFVRGCFAMKRKTLYNNLRSFGIQQEKIKDMFAALNINPQIRGEQLELDYFWKIYRFFYENN